MTNTLAYYARVVMVKTVDVGSCLQVQKVFLTTNTPAYYAGSLIPNTVDVDSH